MTTLEWETDSWLSGKVKDIITSQPAMHRMVKSTPFRILTMPTSREFGHTFTTHIASPQKELLVFLNMVRQRLKGFNSM
jgi:hypothetical protein